MGVGYLDLSRQHRWFECVTVEMLVELRIVLEMFQYSVLSIVLRQALLMALKMD